MSDAENTEAVAEPEQDVEAQGLPSKMDLKVDITEAGPCRKRISVVVPGARLAEPRFSESSLAGL